MIFFFQDHWSARWKTKSLWKLSNYLIQRVLTSGKAVAIVTQEQIHVKKYMASFVIFPGCWVNAVRVGRTLYAEGARNGAERERKKLKTCRKRERRKKNVSNEIKKSNKLHLSIVKGLDDENGYRSTEMSEDLLSCQKILGLSTAAKT